MSVEDYKPRFIFEITEEQKVRANKLISQYGLRKAIFSPILDDVLNLIDEYGGLAIGVIMSGKLKPREVLPSMKRADEIGQKE
ncbi:hypothetical protein MUP59_08710 [Candidatus Bathyarchaeota archaeon]|nr:hypothetical protein [Candidatus Bathyarchaeota archaeon]